MIRKQDDHIIEIIHLLSLYHVMSVQQLCKLYPEVSKETIYTLIKKLRKSGRVTYEKEKEWLFYGTDTSFYSTMFLSALWVLLDFIPHVTYHTVGEFPVVLTFFMNTVRYDVIYIQKEKELLINGIFSLGKEKEEVKRLVIIEEKNQIKQICFPLIQAFCMVSEKGVVQYLKRQGVD